jgi:hypothetical protein
MKLQAIVLGVVCAAAGLVLYPASGQDKQPAGQESQRPQKQAKKDRKAKKADDPGQAAKPAEGAVDPAMEAWMKAGTPGEFHKALEPLNGDWTTESTFWMAPGAEAQQSKGECKRKWILGGRFLEEKVTGSFGGMSFEGFGLLGYDNLKKQYVDVWVDSMSTMILSTTGSTDETRKTFTFTGQYDDPMTGQKNKSMRLVHKIQGPDKHTMLMYETGPDGKEFKSMEMVFTRK